MPKDTKVHLDHLVIRVPLDDLGHGEQWDPKDLKDLQDTMDLMECLAKMELKELQEKREDQELKVHQELM